jgi:hypothetical protein
MLAGALERLASRSRACASLKAQPSQLTTSVRSRDPSATPVRAASRRIQRRALRATAPHRVPAPRRGRATGPPTARPSRARPAASHAPRDGDARAPGPRPTPSRRRLFQTATRRDELRVDEYAHAARRSPRRRVMTACRSPHLTPRQTARSRICHDRLSATSRPHLRARSPSTSNPRQNPAHTRRPRSPPRPPRHRPRQTTARRPAALSLPLPTSLALLSQPLSHPRPSSSLHRSTPDPSHHQLHPVPGPDPARLPLWWLGGVRVRARHRPQTPIPMRVGCGRGVHT